VIQTLVTKEEISICEGSSYNGWTTSGRYERTLQSAAGGDSVVVTRLTVHPVYAVTEFASICEGETYRFGSQLLTKSGVYTEVYETVFGCDSTVVLNLTVNPKYRVTENISIVEGEDYLGWTEPGVYERNLVAATGCDSVVVTNLSVEQLAVHAINLEAGWNIISSYLVPDNQDMVAVVESLIADG